MTLCFLVVNVSLGGDTLMGYQSLAKYLNQVIAQKCMNSYFGFYD